MQLIRRKLTLKIFHISRHKELLQDSLIPLCNVYIFTWLCHFQTGDATLYFTCKPSNFLPFFFSPFDLCLLPFLNLMQFPEYHPATCSPYTNSSNGYLCTLPLNSTIPPCINTVWHSQAVCFSQLIILHLWLAISHFVSMLREHSVTSTASQILLGHCSFILTQRSWNPLLFYRKRHKHLF